jgi:hypothetical protein
VEPRFADGWDSANAPRRVAKVLAMELALRPTLPIDELAFAAIGELAVSYRGERAWYAQARLLPLGGLVGKGHDQGLFGAYGAAGYDHQLFAIGLGMGVLRGSNVWDDYDYDGYEDEDFVFSITQSVRLGALDGLSLNVTNAFVLDDERWNFAFVEIGLQVPVGRRTWLTANGAGGGYAGFFYGELGLRRLLFGDRSGGSLFVRPSVGVAGVDTRDGTWSPGPMVGIHLEWRQ